MEPEGPEWAALQQENQNLQLLVAQLQGQMVQLLAQQAQAGEESENKKIKQLLKMKPEKFKGSPKKDPEDWLYEVEKTLEVTEITLPATQLKAIQFLLEDSALAWWRSVLEDDEVDTPTTLEEFKVALIKRYRTQDPVHVAYDQLIRLRQTGSTKSYADKFDEFAPKAKLTDSAKCRQFMEHLKPKVKLEVQKEYRLNKFKDYEDLRAHAIVYDQAEFNSKDNGSRGTDWRPRGGGNGGQAGSSQPPHNPGATPMDIGSFTRTPKLTPESRAQCIREGRCFFCRQQGHVAENCDLKKERKSHPNGGRQ